MNPPRFVSESEMRALVGPAELRRLMRQTLAQRAAGEDASPPRFAYGSDSARVGVMPVASGGAPGTPLGLKVVGLNPGAGHAGLYLRFDPVSGELTHLFDGGALTALRTAAVSAAVTEALVPPREIRSVAIFGAGRQAVEHLRAFRALVPGVLVRVYARSPESALRLRAQLAPRDLEFVEFSAGPLRAPVSADVICLATNAATPVLDSADLRRARHINAIGSCRPDRREVGGALVAACARYVDSLPQAHREAGDLLLARAERTLRGPLAVEIGELLREGGRVADGRTTFFKSLGLACEDAAYAELLVRKLASGAAKERAA